jgi:hypothetical protein
MALPLQTADGADISASESLPLIAHADAELGEGCVIIFFRRGRFRTA